QCLQGVRGVALAGQAALEMRNKVRQIPTCPVIFRHPLLPHPAGLRDRVPREVGNVETLHSRLDLGKGMRYSACQDPVGNDEGYGERRQDSWHLSGTLPATNGWY